MAYVEIKNLSKKYNTAKDFTIKNLSLTIEKGELITILGKSGCGKTTLLRLLSGFEVPNEGEIILNGKMISSNNVWVPPEKRNIGMIFQDYALFPNMTAFQNIAFAINKDPNYKNKTKNMLKLIGLYDSKHKYPHELSGGQQQRVAIGRALIRQPAILLLDEPFSNLDLELREAMQWEVLKLFKKTETTAIFVTHDQIEALSISKRIAILNEGKIQQIATPYDIYNKPRNSFVSEFIGRANLFTGKIQSSNSILWENIIISCKDNIPYEKGTKLKFMIREEDVFINKNGPLKGTIVSFTYMGMNYSATLSIKTPNNKILMLKILLPGSSNVEIGAEVKLDLFIKSKHHIFLE
ncbi:ABC transporter ATP-binding protein [Clostridium sp. DL1XJH146]